MPTSTHPVFDIEVHPGHPWPHIRSPLRSCWRDSHRLKRQQRGATNAWIYICVWAPKAVRDTKAVTTHCNPTHSDVTAAGSKPLSEVLWCAPLALGEGSALRPGPCPDCPPISTMRARRAYTLAKRAPQGASSKTT